MLLVISSKSLQLLMAVNAKIVRVKICLIKHYSEAYPLVVSFFFAYNETDLQKFYFICLTTTTCQ